MGERAEIVCGHCARSDRDVQLAEVPKGSLTAARLRLANAAEAWMTEIERYHQSGRQWTGNTHALRLVAESALAALRTARGEG